MTPDFETSWRAAWRELALPEPPRAQFEALCARWSEPQRHYHTLQHLAECLALFDEVRGLARHRGELAIAIWFHDAVYEVRRHDNEAESAAWARRALLETGARDEVAGRVQALVMATRHD